MTTTSSSSSSGPCVRLCGEDVERRAGELARPDRLDERVLVDERAAGGVDQARAVPHLRDRLRPDDPDRLVGQRQVERDEVGGAEHAPPARRAFDPDLAEAVVADERVVADDPHPEADRPPRDLLADPAEAEDPERLACELDPAPAGALPAALLQGRMRLRDVARERDQEPDRLLRGRDDGGVGRIRYDDAAVVAASRSTLSIPTPARPIIFSLSARSIRSAVSLVAERMTIAS